MLVGPHSAQVFCILLLVVGITRTSSRRGCDARTRVGVPLDTVLRCGEELICGGGGGIERAHEKARLGRGRVVRPGRALA
jgi:hypothetical protein